MSPDEQSKRTEDVWFMFIDADENENLTAEEYAAFNPWLVERGHAKAICDYMDRDRNGVIEMAEFTNKHRKWSF